MGYGKSIVSGVFDTWYRHASLPKHIILETIDKMCAMELELELFAMLSMGWTHAVSGGISTGVPMSGGMMTNNPVTTASKPEFGDVLDVFMQVRVSRFDGGLQAGDITQLVDGRKVHTYAQALMYQPESIGKYLLKPLNASYAQKDMFIIHKVFILSRVEEDGKDQDV